MKVKSILHIVNHNDAFANDVSLNLIAASDALLFIENGVYNAVSTSADQHDFEQAKFQLFVLLPDLLARGLDQASLFENVKVVDYEGFVDLTASYNVIQSW